MLLLPSRLLPGHRGIDVCKPVEDRAQSSGAVVGHHQEARAVRHGTVMQVAAGCRVVDAPRRRVSGAPACGSRRAPQPQTVPSGKRTDHGVVARILASPTHFSTVGPSATDPIRGRPPECGQSVRNIARKNGFPLLSRWTTRSKSAANDRLVPEERILYPGLLMVSGSFFVIEAEGVVGRVRRHPREVPVDMVHQTMPVVASSVVASTREPRSRPCCRRPDGVSSTPVSRCHRASLRPTFAFAPDGGARAVDDEMEAALGRDRTKADVQLLAPSGASRVVGCGEVDAHHPEKSTSRSPPCAATSRQSRSPDRSTGAVHDACRRRLPPTWRSHKALARP